MSKMWPPVLTGRRFSFFLYQQLIFCIFSLLVGCALFVPKATVVNTVIVEPELGVTPVNFELMGRISANDGEQGFSGGVRWLHINADDEIYLLSPFGQIVSKILRNQDVVVLTTSERKVYRAANVENLTKEILGWRLPILGLQFWVRGVNSPTTKSEMDMDIDGRVMAIRQDGWEIAYSSYFPSQFLQAALPKAMVLNRSGLKIKLVIDNWETK